MTGLTDTSALAAVDAELGSHSRFGASGPILARNLARFRLGLSMLARRDPTATPLAERLLALDDARLQPFLLDPVVRNAFEQDVTAEVPGALGALDGAEPGPPAVRLTSPVLRPWPQRADTWLWTELTAGTEGQAAVLARLRKLYGGCFGGPDAPDPIPATDETLSALRRGADLLGELLPGCGQAVLPHIGSIGLVRRERPDEQLLSLSGGDPLPSTLLVAPERLPDPWAAAESLLHEGLHLKLFDVLRCGSLLDDPERLVPIPWRTAPWTLVRVLFAFHVYSHMTVFRSAALAAGEDVRRRYGPPPDGDEIDEPSPGSPAAAARTHVTGTERARYLADQLVRHDTALTPAGREFREWLVAAVRPVADLSPEAPVGYRRVEPAFNLPLPELGQLVVATGRQPRPRWLSARSWLLYSLCDGRPAAGIAEAYGRSTGDHSGPALDQEIAAGLRRLTETGLVEPV